MSSLENSSRPGTLHDASLAVTIGRAPWFFSLLVVLVAYALPLGNYAERADPNDEFRDPNELSRILCSVSMVLHAAITIDRAMEVYGTPVDRADHDGRTYSDKAPGLALFATPVVAVAQAVLPETGGLPSYWPLRHLLTFVVIGIPGAMLPFLLLRQYPTAAPRQRMALALIFAIATPLLTYATRFHGHVLAAVLVGGAYVLALRPGCPEKTPKRLVATLSGWLAGSAVMVEYPTALLGLVVFVSLWANTRSLRSVAWFTAGGIVGILPMLLYHQAAYGAFWETGYSHEVARQFAEVHEQGLLGVRLPTAAGLWGVLFSAKRGLFFYCPLLLLAPVGLVPMVRRHPRDAWPLIAAGILYVFFASGFVLWTGGSSAAARHLVPLLPLLLFPLCEAATLMASRLWSWIVFVILTGFSLAGALLSIALTPYFPPKFEVPLFQVTLRSLGQGAALPNLVTDVCGVPAIGVLAGFSIFLTGTLLVALWQMGPKGGWRYSTALVLPLAMAAYVGFQAAIAPGPTTPQESTRSILLEKIGYPRQARQIQERLRGPSPREM